MVSAYLAICLQGSSALPERAAYLQARKRFGVTQAIRPEALASFVGTKIAEIAGTVQGTCEIGGRQGIMVAKANGESETVTADVVPDWIAEGMAVRLLVRAVRETETSGLEATLIAIARESDVATEEARQRKVVTKKVLRPASRSMVRAPRRALNWRLPASEVTPVYASFIHRINPRLPVQEAYRIATGVVGFSLRFDVDARLIMAMVMVESGFNPEARSHAGAMGLGQLMPGTAAGIGVGNAYNTEENLYGTVRLVRRHLESYNRSTGDGYRSLLLTIAAYNAGPGAVKRHGGIPPYRETQRYVRKVMSLYYQFAGLA